MDLLPSVPTILGWLFVGFLGLGILVNYLPTNEQANLVETTCHMINLVVTKDVLDCTQDTYRTLGGFRQFYEKTDTKLIYKYNPILAKVSVDFPNETCRKATLYRSYEDGKETKFKFSANECKYGIWDITSFTSGLEQDGKFTCSYDRKRPRRAFVVYRWPIWKITTIVLLLFLTWYSFPTICLYFKVPTMEEAIQDIIDGDICGVKKYFRRKDVNDELWRNGVVFSPLTIAAQVGQVSVMDYFYSLGANTDYTEDETEMGVFHYACLSDDENTIQWCLDKNLNVNKLTAKGETPLMFYIQASEQPSIDLFRRMILDTTNLNTRDSTGRTVLRYACMKRNWTSDVKREAIELLIKAGCLPDQATDGTTVSSFSILLLNGEFDLCELIIEAGYGVTSDKTLPFILNFINEKLSDTQRGLLSGEFGSVPPLQRLCRTAVRRALGARGIRQDLNLPIPKRLNEFLSLNGIVQNTGVSEWGFIVGEV